MKIDLHMHSCYSPDGQLTCQQLVDMAKEKGMDVIALSDHDLLTGVEEISHLAAKENIEVIPALECSTLLGDYTVHVLGYGVDINDPYLNSVAGKMEEANKDVFAQRVKKLEDKYDLKIDLEQILKDAKGKNPWFTLIDQILLDPKILSHPDFQDYIPGGSRSDPAPVNFFWDRCQPGSDLYVKNWSPDFYETIDRIHEAGGTAIIAHPFNTFFQKEDLLQSAIDRGIDGLEVYSNYHTPEMNDWYENFARKKGLLMTCGSDFHGEKKPSIEMGEYGYDGPADEIYKNLKERIQKNQEQTQVQKGK